MILRIVHEKRKGKKNFSLIHFEKCHFILHELSNVLDTMNIRLYIYTYPSCWISLNIAEGSY